MKTVCVFGDPIVDRDIYVKPQGSAGSEGLTALFASWQREHYSLGGAGRVASIIAKQDKAMLYSSVGGPAANIFETAARGLNVELPLLTHVGRDGLTFKNRIWDATRPAAPRLLMRYDQDAFTSWSTRDSSQVYDDLIPDDAVLCVVDHGKGCCNAEMKRAVMQLAESKKRVLLVDPGKDNDLEAYGSPTTIFKFNAQQAQRYCATRMPTRKIYDWDSAQPEEDYIETMDRVVESLQGITYGGLCITFGAGGLIYAVVRSRENPRRHSRCKVLGMEAADIRDTCGAGDAVMASLAMNVSPADIESHTAMETIANTANKAGYTACLSHRMDR